MSDSTVCDVNGIFILRPMKKRERTKKERAAFLRVSRSETFPSRRCEADVSQFYYEEVFLNTRARRNERLCDERRVVTVRLHTGKVNVNNRIYNKQLYLKVNGERGRQQLEIITTP